MSVTQEQAQRSLSMPRDLRTLAIAAHIASCPDARPLETRWLRMVIGERLGIDAATAPAEMRPSGGNGGLAPAVELDGLWFAYDVTDGLCLLHGGTRYQIDGLADLGRLLSELAAAS